MGEKYRKSSVRSKKESNIRNNKRSSKRNSFILNAIRINRQRNRFGIMLAVFIAIFTIMFIFNVYKRLPDIISGAGAITSNALHISNFKGGKKQ